MIISDAVEPHPPRRPGVRRREESHTAERTASPTTGTVLTVTATATSAATATTTRMTTIRIGILIVTVTAADGGHVTDPMTATTTDVVVKVAGPPPLPPIGRTGDLDLSHPAALPLRPPPDGEAAARGVAPPADIHH